MHEQLDDALDAFQRCVEVRDVAGAEDVLHRAFQLVVISPEIVVVPRERWLAMLPDYVVHDYDVEEQTLDVDGDVAAGATRVHMRATVLGAPREGVFVISDVWRAGEDGWRLWRRHSTPFSAGRFPDG